MIMEFHEKLQQLRKQKGLTQEALAEALFVSRTAISKWESGRGYPSIDSLKALSGFFSVSIDELLSGEELLTIAREDTMEKESSFRSLVFGLLDCSTVLFFFLPFFGQAADGSILAVSLLSLDGISPWLKSIYFLVVIGIFVWGILTLVLQNYRHTVWRSCGSRVSLLLNTVALLLFIVSQQPYAAVFLFVLTTIKVIMLIKKP